jgi:hypothetical protein
MMPWLAWFRMSVDRIRGIQHAGRPQSTRSTQVGQFVIRTRQVSVQIGGRFRNG